MDWFDEFVAVVDPIIDPNLGKKTRGSIEFFLGLKNCSSTREVNFAINALRLDTEVTVLGVGVTQRDWYLVAFVATSLIQHCFLTDASTPWPVDMGGKEERRGTLPWVWGTRKKETWHNTTKRCKVGVRYISLSQFVVCCLNK